MTNHIEELMKAVGVETKTESYCKWECEKPALETSPICHDADCLFRKIRTFYPAFTPEKQLELIKLVLKKPYIEWEQYFENNKFIMKADMPDETYACLTIDVENTEYTLALAEFITELLKIKRLEKSEVKRILEYD